MQRYEKNLIYANKSKNILNTKCILYEKVL